MKRATFPSHLILNVTLCYLLCYSKKKLCAIYGKWTECLYTIDAATFDAHKKTDKKSPEDRKTNKRVSFNVVGPRAVTGAVTSACVWCRTAWTRSRRRCLHLMPKQSRSSQAASSSGRSRLARETPPRSGLVNEAGIMGRILLASLKNSVLSSLQQFYAFSTFAMQLNALEKSMEGVIAPTDSRLRPDIRALENGDIGTLCGSDTAGSGSCSHWVPERTTACVDLASAEKKRLEEKQRMARKNRSKSTDEWKTRQVDPTRPVPSCFAGALLTAF